MTLDQKATDHARILDLIADEGPMIHTLSWSVVQGALRDAAGLLRQYVGSAEEAPRPEGGEKIAEALVRAETLLRRIADANVIFPSLCANNLEAMHLSDALKLYRSLPQPQSAKEKNDG